MIKCVGCYQLRREELQLSGKTLVVYDCIRDYFPYAAALSGILRPSVGFIQSISLCPEQIDKHCILCSGTWCNSFGWPPIAYACKDHGRAWGDWLSDSDRRHYLAPKGRLRKDRWVELFRQFIEEIRKETS